MKIVFLDVDTQIDFLYPAGALYVPGAERIVPAVARLNRYASENGIPLYSTVDAHAENDPEFAVWPPHCVAGTTGQAKPASLMTGQTVIEKQTVNTYEVLGGLEGDRFVVYGVVAEICVKHAAMGLLGAGKRVEIVIDAIKELTSDARAAMLAAFTAAGGILTTVDEVCKG
jgi:nicotinamidase/pyrazinamidase